MSSSRRRFLNQSAKLAAAAGLSGLAPTAAQSQSMVSANDTVRIALIGANSMGFGDLNNALKLPNVTCVALCDIDDAVLARRAADVEKIQGKKPALLKDFRQIMDDKTIDAVIIGTPDHWHCLPFVAACEAGKDIYVEKPLANSLAECQVMIKAARKYGRVVQVGQQQRSGDHWKKALDFIKSGQIGMLRKVNVWGNFRYGIGQPLAVDSPVPDGVDFDQWLGPAPTRSFNKSRFHGSWRMFWDYGGGLLTDWGVHLLDMALWAKDIKNLPQTVTATGGNFGFADHAHETFDTMNVSYQLPDFLINWEHTAGIQSGPFGRSYGLAFVGNDATLVIDRNGWEVYPELAETGQTYKVPKLPPQSGRDYHAEHMKNFIECIKSRQDPACTIENGALVASYAHMGNIALRTQSQLNWNETTKNFGSNTAANALITPTYRKPWVLPVI
ncbi:Gfo/Idh/MocA family protein [Arundinibacter roseus]|uniref:Gfo/Idh/MocA family oxidoreductase n=1 Tax=Arundinibacter roseus TaxID=2070510 RepID=A0A4V2XAA4_9BACT|nr:Gfo/Idh/MocA family oxidoreductase [Arundinibacter roseus]TDB66885.1 Gfo/Idh/MocA family oxidoreductase [Arundinibacter roseus]